MVKPPEKLAKVFSFSSGLGKEDNLEKGKKLIDKILKYRFFDDEQGKMGWNVSQASGGFIAGVPITLMAQTQKAYVRTLVPQCQVMQKPCMNSWLNMRRASSKMYKPVFLQLI